MTDIVARSDKAADDITDIKIRFRSAVVVPWMAGSGVAASHGMHGATGNIYCGSHEYADIRFLHFLREDDLFVDTGANIGSYTVLSSRVAGARTIAFEADPGTFSHLHRNIEANGIEHFVSAHGEELLRRMGFMRAYYDPASRTISDRSLGIEANNVPPIRDFERASLRVRDARSFNVAGVQL